MVALLFFDPSFVKLDGLALKKYVVENHINTAERKRERKGKRKRERERELQRDVERKGKRKWNEGAKIKEGPFSYLYINSLLFHLALLLFVLCFFMV